MDLMTFEEAAEFLHVPVPTLRYWQMQGEAPPSARIGKRRMFRKSDLIAFVDRKFADAS